MAAFWLFATQKDGISALALKRGPKIGSNQTVWAMLHRCARCWCASLGERLCGEVEVDETYLHRQPRAGCGGKAAPGDLVTTPADPPG